MSLTTLMQDIDDWCGTPTPGHPPRPPWLRDILTAVVLAELSANLSGTNEGRSLYAAAAPESVNLSEALVAGVY